MYYLRKDIENKSIIWFENSDQYLVFEPIVADIIEDLTANKSSEKIAKTVAKTVDVPFQESLDFISNIDKNILQKLKKEISNSSAKNESGSFKGAYQYKKFYKISSKVIFIEYQSLFELELIHPKFGHLECDYSNDVDLHFDIFTINNQTYLFKDSNYFNDWSRKNIHYLQGKVSMLIVQHIYQNTEDDWIGVFHASALSNGKKSILFLGDSGNGKSTSLALLQKQGYECIADDFVPVGIDKRVYAFPSAISVKKNSWKMLSEYYPTLISEKEYHFASHNKTIKYLTPQKQDFDKAFHCNQLVFIKYKKDASTSFFPIFQVQAFEKLLPDSWISKKEENVTTFLDWFSSTKSYSLTYSNNQEMFDLVAKLYKDEL